MLTYRDKTNGALVSFRYHFPLLDRFVLNYVSDVQFSLLMVAVMQDGNEVCDS